MIGKKLSEAKEYTAPNHRQCTTLRLFGAEAGGSKALIAGVSHFLPGGGAGPDDHHGALRALQDLGERMPAFGEVGERLRARAQILVRIGE